MDAAKTLQGQEGIMRSKAQSEPSGSRIRIQPFDYRGVRLRTSRWQEQYQSAWDVHFSVPDENYPYRMYFDAEALPFVLV